MPVEFIGSVGSHNASEIHPPRGPVIDRDYVEPVARAHEDGGLPERNVTPLALTRVKTGNQSRRC